MDETSEACLIHEQLRKPKTPGSARIAMWEEQEVAKRASLLPLRPDASERLVGWAIEDMAQWFGART